MEIFYGLGPRNHYGILMPRGTFDEFNFSRSDLVIYANQLKIRKRYFKNISP